MSKILKRVFVLDGKMKVKRVKKYDINISNINLIFGKYPTIRIISDQNIF